MKQPISIGSTVWLFDINRRVYSPDKSRPIWIEHWVERKIVGENRRSWLLDRGKVSKKPVWPESNRVAFSWDEVLDQVWRHEHVYRIVRCVEFAHPAILRQIAALVGYKEQE